MSMILFGHFFAFNLIWIPTFFVTCIGLNPFVNKIITFVP